MRLARDFESIKKNAAKVECSAFVLYFSQSDSGASRLGVVASRKTGCAVERNLVRRRIRAVFAEVRADFPFDADVLVFARRAAAKFEYADIKKKFKRAVSAGAAILQKRRLKTSGGDSDGA